MAQYCKYSFIFSSSLVPDLMCLIERDFNLGGPQVALEGFCFDLGSSSDDVLAAGSNFLSAVLWLTFSFLELVGVSVFEPDVLAGFFVGLGSTCSFSGKKIRSLLLRHI